MRWGVPHGWITPDPSVLLGDVHWQAPTGVITKAEIQVQGTDVLWADPEEDIPSSEAVADLAEAIVSMRGSKDWWALMPLMAAHSGIRLGEMLELRVPDVDLGDRKLGFIDSFSTLDRNAPLWSRRVARSAQPSTRK